MPILSLTFQNGHDIHVVAGQKSPDLLQSNRLAVRRKKADGTIENIWATDDKDPNEVISFKPLFKNTQTTIGTDTFFDGFGIRVNQKTGEVTLTNPLPATRKANFILEVEGDNTSLLADDKGRKVSAFIRVHIHQSVSKVWLTPSVLTVHQYKKLSEQPFPQETQFKFSVRAQFDDDVVGNITDWPGITWGPANRVKSDTGHIIIQSGDAAGNTFPVTAKLPAAAGGLTTSPSSVRTGDSWVSGATTGADIVPGGGWPGIINPSDVPNVLFLGDGYGNSQADKDLFSGYVTSLVSYMKGNPINHPYDVLATSINFWAGWLPSDKKGITIRGEVFPMTEGAVRYAYFVPAPVAPPTDPAEIWKMKHVIYTVGLPLSSHEGKSVADIRDEWTQQLTADPNAKISDDLVQKWQSMAKRSLVEAVDTPLGVASGDTITDINYNLLTLDENRMTREIMDAYLRTLSTSSGVVLSNLWLWGPDPKKPASNNADLICIIPAGIGRAQNEDGFFFVNPLGFNKIAVKDFSGTKAFELDEANLSLPATADDERGRLLAHELSHSFFIGDEYWETDTVSTAKSADIDPDFSNLQTTDSIKKGADIDGDEIKWNWHRIYKAAVLSGDLQDVSATEWKVALRTGQGNQFAIGDTVHFRFRQYPKSLEKFPKISIPLVIKERAADSVTVEVKGAAADPVYPATLQYPAASLVQPGQFKTTFKEGCILYIPKPAPDSVKSEVYAAEMVALNIKKFITANHRALTDPAVIYPNKDEQVPNFEFAGAVSKPDLPFCFNQNKPRIVGLYEGGQLDRKGIYHPTGHCIMRDSHTDGREFCAVCRYILVDTIDPYKHFAIDVSYDKIYPQK